MKTKNVAVNILFAVLATALWYQLLLKPTRSQTSKIKADTASEQAKLTPLESQLAQARKDASHAAEFKAQLVSLQAAMPDSPALAEFIRDLNGIAAASDVSWQSVTHAAPTAGTDAVMSITVGITIKGTYPQVMDYLGRLAELQRLLVVDNVTFNPASTDATSGTGGGSGTSAGGGASHGGSTGPFSGADQLAVSISGRMFETPGPALGSGAASGTATVGATSGTSSAPAAQTSALNNS